MSSSSIHPSEVDEAADFVDQFYLGVEKSDAASTIEEQEDVGLYNLYDHRTPWPCLKSPTGAVVLSSTTNSNTPLDMPFDQEVLARKLRSYIESTPLHGSSKPIPGLDAIEQAASHTAKGRRPSVGSSDVECGGPTNTVRAHERLHKN